MSRFGRLSGGIVVFVEKSISSKVKRICESCSYAIFIVVDKEVFGLPRDVLICYAYIPPEVSTFYLKTDVGETDGIIMLQHKLQSILDMYENDLLLLVIGDLNARCGDLSDFITDDSTKYLPLYENQYMQSFLILTGILRIVQ